MVIAETLWLRLQTPPMNWILVLILAMVASALGKMGLRFLARKLHRLEGPQHHWYSAIPELLNLTKQTVLFIWLFAVFAHSLEQPSFFNQSLNTLVIVATTYQLIRWGLCLLRHWHQSRLLPKIEHDRSSAAALSMFYTAARAVLVLAFVLVALSQLGINISALLTGLGIGGIAVALAAQNILGDLLASLSIILDKPFVVGDYIVSGQEQGTVEHIGVKTTRIRSLSGEQIILSNKDLLESRVRNFQRLDRRRCALKFSISLSTPPESLAQIPSWLEEIVRRQDLLRFDTCALIGVNTTSFDFEVVFFVLSAEWPKFLQMQQTVLIQSVRRLQEAQVMLAIPAQRLVWDSGSTPSEPRLQPSLPSQSANC